jgi:GMP reductase
MRIEEDVKLDFRDVLIRPKRSTLGSRSEVDITRTFQLRHTGGSLAGVPVMASNMDTIGTFAMARALAAHDCSTVLHKFYPPDAMAAFYRDEPETVLNRVWYSMGATKKDLERFRRIDRLIADDAGDARRPRRICIDVANGYQESFVDFVKAFRDAVPDAAIMAGNVVTGDLVEQLIISGTDMVKVGIGPGSVCTTRQVTGVGYPQLSAVIECADAAHGLGGLICSDGGCAVPGDLAKAFGGGADFVMLGGMLAGHDECEGELRERDGVKTMLFYGMSSSTAMERHHGGVAGYRAAEGRTVEVPYRGSAAATMGEILGGLRSAMTYIGARRLKEVSKRTTFVRLAPPRDGAGKPF